MGILKLYQTLVAPQYQMGNNIIDAAVNVTITSAQVLALFATPQTIVAAPGAGFALLFEGALLHKPAGTAYGNVAVGDDIAIKYTSAAGLTVGSCETVGFLDASTAQTRFIRAHTAASGVSDITPAENAVLVVQILLTEVTDGTSPLLVRTFYRTVPTVLA